MILVSPERCNVGTVERWVRVLLAIILAVSGLYVRANFAYSAGVGVLWFSAFLFLTGVFRWCPMTWLRFRVFRT